MLIWKGKPVLTTEIQKDGRAQINVAGCVLRIKRKRKFFFSGKPYYLAIIRRQTINDLQPGTLYHVAAVKPALGGAWPLIASSDVNELLIDGAQYLGSIVTPNPQAPGFKVEQLSHMDTTGIPASQIADAERMVDRAFDNAEFDPDKALARVTCTSGGIVQSVALVPKERVTWSICTRCDQPFGAHAVGCPFSLEAC
jgi:hypothetical protein